MARIFFGLALFAVLLLITNAVVGYLIGDLSAASHKLVAATDAVRELEREGGAGSDAVRLAAEAQRDAAIAFRPVNRRSQIHLLLGIASALVVVLVNSITVTYFIGTSRWCREVVDTYELEESLAERSLRLKRKTFPWAFASILTVLAIISLGAASDPPANPASSADWVLPHSVAAILGTVIIGYAFLIQVGNIGSNYVVIEEILDRVKRMREARGLDAPADAMDTSPTERNETEDPCEESPSIEEPLR